MEGTTQSSKHENDESINLIENPSIFIFFFIHLPAIEIININFILIEKLIVDWFII